MGEMGWMRSKGLKKDLELYKKYKRIRVDKN